MTSCEEGRRGGEELKNCVCLGLGSAGMGDFLEEGHWGEKNLRVKGAQAWAGREEEGHQGEKKLGLRVPRIGQSRLD